MKDVYMDNLLVYKISDNERFTGIAQEKRKNGHLINEDKYEDGIVQWTKLYFNTKEKLVSDKIVYHKYKLWEDKERIRFRLSQDTLHIKTYDENGKKLLVREFENNKLIYSCEYNGRKKHGQEICYDDDGNELVFKYVNGRKIKETDK
ncbi:hypothetical protein FGM00_02870 [Aggregatimonas sangjinii]|uniref:Toxin-antitoxin system YwqK family antitoxin n=1 Tax=Aggregatimonas sangjinii TaxID=2583587 RepID=A0A5B7SKV2_9FLAO|nr:hypothetical protein [Aggregatimonas sangjinii]QCW99106.1 hypothetical protein FGM00_02870 [Aggregatimonas sangjinii]